MNKDIILFFHWRSPYSYFGLNKIARAGSDIIDRVKPIPFLLDLASVQFDDPIRNPNKLSYFREDVTRIATRMSLPIIPPVNMHVDWAPVYEAFFHADAANKGFKFALAVSEAFWGQAKDFSNTEPLGQIATRLGIDLNLPPVIGARADAEAAIEKHGVFGVPFAIAPSGRYWGQDRIDLMLADLKVTSTA